MSLNLIYDFQQTIYKLLSGDSEIRLNVDKIYLSIVQDAKYPFILISILNIENISQYIQAIYEINFEICVFARDKNAVILTSLADKITYKLVTNGYSSDRYNVSSIKACSVNFSRSTDLISSKLTISYKALLKSNL